MLEYLPMPFLQEQSMRKVRIQFKMLSEYRNILLLNILKPGIPTRVSLNPICCSMALLPL